jgi:type IV pilus assembly protein PilX
MNALNKAKPINRQAGVVLFIALIALVVMSLAAAALVRSVDTNTTIAGNLAFKQSAIVASDRGMETAMDWVRTQALANIDSLNTDNLANGYLATLALNLDDSVVLKNTTTWANSGVATGEGISAGVEDETKNEIRYIVQRMCRNATAPGVDHCMFGSGEAQTSSAGGSNDYVPPPNITTLNSPVYRVTVRVKGPKNTVSYTQTYVY